MSSPNPRPIAEHLHHAVLRMPSTLVLGDLDAQHRFRFDRQAGRHLDTVEALAVQVFPLTDIDAEPVVYVIVEEEHGNQYGVYSTKALADEAIGILQAHGSLTFHVEEEPLRNAIDPILGVDVEGQDA